MAKKITRIIRGKAHTFDKADIERKMRGVDPGPISKYSILVSGKEYPLRQVFAHYTGLPPQAFTTQDAYRTLSALEFEIKYYPAGKGR